MIEDEMIGEEVDHVIEIEETIVSIMMDTIEEVVDMMIVEGLILKIYQWKYDLIHFYVRTSLCHANDTYDNSILIHFSDLEKEIGSKLTYHTYHSRGKGF